VPEAAQGERDAEQQLHIHFPASVGQLTADGERLFDQCPCRDHVARSSGWVISWLRTVRASGDQPPRGWSRTAWTSAVKVRM
jgi:hypothetical protein